MPKVGTLTGTGVSLSRYGTLFQHRSFPAFLAAGALQFAAPATILIVLVYGVSTSYPGLGPAAQTSYAGLALAFLGLSSALPTLGSAFFSGALADRHDRGQLMRLINLISIASTAGLAADLTFAPGRHVAAPGPAGFYLPLWVVLAYPAYALLMASTAMFRPAFNTSIPRLVDRSELGTANGLIYAVAAVLTLLVSLLVGVVIAERTVVYSLGIPFGLLFGTQVALLRVDTDLSVNRTGPKRSVTSEAKAGFRYLARRHDLLEITIAALVVNFLSALALVEIGAYLHGWLDLSNAFWYGTLVAVLTAGTAVGFALASRLRFEVRAGRIIIALTFAMGLLLLAFGLVRSLWYALPIAFVYGMMPGMFMTIFLSTVQATVPDEMMGRVFSADEVGSYALVPVGQLSGGLLVALVGVQATYLTAGGAVGAFALLMLAAFGALRRLGYPRETPPVPEPPSGH